MKKSFKICIITVAIFLCILICILPNKRNEEYPSDLYEKISEINDNESLIGLSEEEVIEILGEPLYEDNIYGRIVYTFEAGYTTKKSFLGKEYGSKVYHFRVCFDENNKVINTYMWLTT